MNLREVLAFFFLPLNTQSNKRSDFCLASQIACIIQKLLSSVKIIKRWRNISDKTPTLDFDNIQDNDVNTPTMVFINQEFEETTKNYKKGRTDERKEYLRSQISGLKMLDRLKKSYACKTKPDKCFDLHHQMMKAREIITKTSLHEQNQRNVFRCNEIWKLF